MTDYFALLGEERRPWLDPDALKEKFILLSSRTHPDRVHDRGQAERQAAQKDYTDLNAAYQCLRVPGQRLRHLLGLEAGGVPRETADVPPDVMDLFMRVSPACRRADQALDEKRTLNSPLLTVNWFLRNEPCRAELDRLRQELAGRSRRLLDELKAADERWLSAREDPAMRPALLAALEDLYRKFSYFDRWTKQLQDRLFQFNP